MVSLKVLPFITDYMELVNKSLKKMDKEKELSSTQRYWFSFCILSIILTNTVCWAKFERLSIGLYKIGALSWMFRKSAIPWEEILQASLATLLEYHGITHGEVSVDDTDNRRSKSTSTIYGVSKQIDKTTGGYMMGQKLVIAVLITPTITIPIGFRFYRPDPVLQKWIKENDKLKKEKVPKSKRPKKPLRNSSYPTITECGLKILKEFQKNNPDIKIRTVLADALYGTKAFMDEASEIFSGAQVISQIRKSQIVGKNNLKQSIQKYFTTCSPLNVNISLRGGEDIPITMCSVRHYLQAHSKKRILIALKYKGEEEYRYLVATNSSWRDIDIVKAYTLRWLIEVFFQDWKGHEGWETLTKHPNKEGSYRSLILSLMADHCLFFHADQKAHKENHDIPVYTVGSLCQKIKMEALINDSRYC